MITILLWRCPLCNTDDALSYRVRWLRPDHLSCAHCGTEWQVQRVIGDDYRLRVIKGEASSIGLELPLAEWYDRMKAGFRLTPLQQDSVALGHGELLYLRGQEAAMIVRADNPLLVGWDQRDAPMGPLAQELVPKWETLEPGCLYMTEQRLIWEGEETACDFWWERVNAVFTWFTRAFGIMYGTTTYRFSIPGQSVLKWLTYSGELAKALEARSGRRIAVSHY